MGIRVLLIEDEREIADFVGPGSARGGLHRRAGRRRRRRLAPPRAPAAWDVVLLDWWLPGPDGLTLLRRLPPGGRDTPVLFLTARDAVSDRVRGLDGGADDYLCKPFAFEELLARVRALARRPAASAGDRRWLTPTCGSTWPPTGPSGRASGST